MPHAVRAQQEPRRDDGLFPCLAAVQVLFEPYHLVSARGSIVAKFDEAYCCMHVISSL